MRTRAGLLAAVAVAALLTGCGSDDEGSGDDPGLALDGTGDDGAGGAPDYSEECSAAFPIWFGDPDLGTLEMMPDSWPEPIEDATLCRTSSTLGDGQQVADFATSTPPAAVLDAYEEVLGQAGYELHRGDPGGLGHEVVSGTTGEVGFQIDAIEGGYSLMFIEPGSTDVTG